MRVVVVAELGDGATGHISNACGVLQVERTVIWAVAQRAHEWAVDRIGVPPAAHPSTRGKQRSSPVLKGFGRAAGI